MGTKRKAQNSKKQPRKRRGTRGSWRKGQSGNPGGRPKIPKEVIFAARAHTLEALETLAYWMRRKGKGVGHVAVRAATELLGRGWGQIPQSLQLTGSGPDGEIPVKHGGKVGHEIQTTAIEQQVQENLVDQAWRAKVAQIVADTARFGGEASIESDVETPPPAGKNGKAKTKDDGHAGNGKSTPP